jgi:hypothetical protein
VDFFLSDGEAMAVRVANWALTCHISAGIAVGEGSLYPSDVNLDGKLLQ